MVQRGAVLLGLFTLTVAAGPALGEVKRGGAEQAVSVAKERQRNPVVSIRADGSGWVVWENLAQGLVARRLAAPGQPVGDEIVLAANRNLQTIPSQGRVIWYHEPSIAALPDGGFALAWIRERLDLRVEPFWEARELVDRVALFQRFDATGRAIDRPLVLDDRASAPQGLPQLVLGDGFAGVVWQQALTADGRIDRGDLRGRFLDLAGGYASPTFRIAGPQSVYAGLALDRTGVMWVSWQAPDGSGDGVFVRRYYANGRPLGPATRVNQTITGCQRRGALVERPAGGFWVFFHGPTADPDDNMIYARRLTADAVPVGADLGVSPADYDDEVYPAVARLGGNRYLLMWMAWWKNMPQGFVGLELRDDGGGLEAVGEPVVLNEFRAYTQFRTALAAAGGRAVAAWESLAPLQRKAGVSVQTIGLGD